MYSSEARWARKEALSSQLYVFIIDLLIPASESYLCTPDYDEGPGER